MTHVPLCREDPLLSLLDELFGVNLVRVPDARVQPLTVVAERRGRCFFRGSLLPLLADARPLGLEPADSPVADLAGRRSRRVTFDLGAHILRGFLKGFGLPSAELTAALAGAGALSFSFDNVRRRSLDLNALGWALAGRQIDRENPAAAIFFGWPACRLLLIDTVLTSRRVTVTLSGDSGSQVGVDVSALRQIVAGLDGRVEGGGDHEVSVSLEHPTDLTFAFSCVRFELDAHGRIATMPPDVGQHILGSAYADASWPGRVLLGERPGLVVWDRPTEPQPQKSTDRRL